jgi:hypothetical protein
LMHGYSLGAEAKIDRINVLATMARQD